MGIGHKNLIVLTALLSVSLVVLIASQISLSKKSIYEDETENESVHDVYVLKSYWHTGIILKYDSLIVKRIPPLKNIPQAEYYDIGWGDEDFYQDQDDFDLLLALKAIGIPSSSVIRATGYVSEIAKLINWSDFALKFALSDKQYIRLCDYIYNTFELDEKHKEVITSKRAGGQIIFFKASPDYHLLNTCNTWVAKAFKYAGFEIETTNLITADNLFQALKNHGLILKEE